MRALRWSGGLPSIGAGRAVGTTYCVSDTRALGTYRVTLGLPISRDVAGRHAAERGTRRHRTQPHRNRRSRLRGIPPATDRGRQESYLLRALEAWATLLPLFSSTQSPGPIRTGNFAARRQKGPDRLARLPSRRRWRTAAIRSCRCWARPRSSLRISRLMPRIGHIVGCGRSGVLPMHENGGGRCHIGRCRGRPAARTHHKPLLERATRRAHCSFGPRSTGILRGPSVGRTTRAPHEHVSQTRPVTKDSDRRP